MLNQIKQKLVHLSIFAITLSIGCSTVSAQITNLKILFDSSYPDVAKQVVFKKIKEDSLLIDKEIEFFGKTNMTFGNVTGIDVDADHIYIADGKKNRIYVFDRKTNAYQQTIGAESEDDPAHIAGLFGIHIWNNLLLAGTGQGSFVRDTQPHLFKVFSKSGTFFKNYKNISPVSWGIARDANSSFIYDSTAYVVKMIADKRFKMVRLKLSNQFEQIGDEILPVTDFQGNTDSATLSKILTSLYVIKSSLLKQFYAIPSNKFLINCYDMDGKLLTSFDLRDIPEFKYAYELNERIKLSNAYFSSVASNAFDNIYIPVQKIINPEVLNEGRPNELKVNTYILSVNVLKREYGIYHIKNIAAAPLKIIDGKLWGYDAGLSKLVIFKLPN
jgi:hypothetical protein